MAITMEEDRTCWICLCGPDGLEAGEEDQVVRVCGCPRVCHKRCLGRWQLQNAGKREEKYCRFCQQRYPDWRSSLTPGEITPSTPVMAVSVRGKVYKLRVRSGPEGKEDFKRQIRQLLGFTQDMDFDVIFECKTPHNGAEKVQLHGFEAFEAASWCAAVSAAKRKKAKQEAAARAAAAAAAAASACAGSLVPMASCPAALASGTESRPSSSGSSTGGATSSDGGCDLQGSGRDVSPEPVHGTARVHGDAAAAHMAPSAFATATAAVTGCPADAVRPLLSHAVSEPTPDLTTACSHHPASGPQAHRSSTSTPPNAGRAAAASSSEEDEDAAPLGSIDGPRGYGSSSNSSSARRSSSCPGEGFDRYHHGGFNGGGVGVGHSAAHSRASYTSGLQSVQSVPHGSSSSSMDVRGGGGMMGSDDGTDGGDRRGKVTRWLRRVLHLEGPWRGAMPAGVFMGVV